MIRDLVQVWGHGAGESRWGGVSERAGTFSILGFEYRKASENI